ncbi:MAG: Asp-tRNA(Asn)/Glu-tRNA(Gln) amidotransferase subunit GatC [Gammaproteobacteria bacterium]|jgi:aspartyl-tRNA(Asn)/glutamyl-tRNA(Gln) amidotransferase subunit C|nr:Asp-tRNA(Asn)/Glu-tRNA(Gln) amidotransferase subunit GatC [Gammaproteobacteria bacterium]MDA8869036.1 Asp-tRNA(Asn)/Glu-tRNA(Gln) amidotransferase subunit GatC [Pseudomonadales bacterium]MDB3996127.1 Asp-tRNA(Asn)/Glu-tRNA(Gln) amidotransferase subunit GatC [bacterium]MBT5333853.1 Asp-tRNA(Asn)/Glu-tRNA(Gln) amidotransferase subunit GatC [Gammaproteobacteria bacterium]MBT5683239.1 Asp-tRNA(Asn)/Glu-tRNA(Gln) amidotransferase subunit GatC [Gammaproteobacteria bacterium]|tara:strand:+ start:1565 stop:1861 length:297 start_codon:yes stop_codon:yes gene_type:complete
MTDQDNTEINVTHLARLGRLAIPSSSHASTAQELQNIIAMIDAMQSVDTDGIEPLSHPLDSEQLLRADVVSETDSREAFQNNAPKTEDGYYLVPRVVD